MQKSLAKNAIYNIIYRILNVIFPLITTAYVSRVLEPSGVGKVAYAQNIVSYFLMFAVLGIPRYGTREIAKVRNNPIQTNKLFSELIVINTVSTAVCVLSYYIVVAAGLGRGTVVYLVCGAELLFNFINIDWLYEGEEEYIYITVRSVLIKIISIVAMFLFVKREEDHHIYALITCLGLGCNNIFNVIHARKRVRLTFKNLEIKRHLKPIFILAISVVVSSLYSKVNVTVLGWFSTEENIGYYTNAHKVVNIAMTLVTAISGVFMPRLSYLYSSNKTRFCELISTGLKLVLFFAIPCCVGLILIAEDIVTLLFGNLFYPSIGLIQIMAVLIVIVGAGDLLCYQAIISSGNENHLIKSRVIAGVTSLCLSFTLIPKWQHTGAAIAITVSELVVNGVLLKKALEIVKLSIPWRSVIASITGSAIMGITVIGIQILIDNCILSVILSVTVGVIVYLSAERLMKNDIVLELKKLAREK